MIDRTGEEIDLETSFWVGPYLVRPSLHRIEKDGESLRVEPKVMQVLLCLARRPGQVVTKDEFMERVWSDTVVMDDALLRCISELRKTFDDDAHAPQFIETIRTRGYRLIAPVSPARRALTEPSAPDVHPAAGTPPETGAASPETPAATYWSRLLRSAQEPRFVAAVAALMVLLVGGILSFRFTQPVAPAAPLQTVLFTSYPGEEAAPALSPDGDRVAFIWNKQNAVRSDLFVKQMGAETPLQLTDHPAAEHSPAWSPDGRQIVFVRAGGEGNGIFIVPAVGGSERQVLNLGAREVQHLAWSPNGQALVFSARTMPDAVFDLYLLSLETLEERQLTSAPSDYRGDLEPAFAPDGRTVAFVRSVIEKIEDIFVVPVRGGTPRRLTDDSAEITGLDWTPDGRSIIFASDRGGPLSLWKVAATGGAPQWIATPNGSDVYQPALARRGRRMVYVQQSFETNLWQRPIASADAPTRLIASTRWDSNPHVSPDGRRIAFASDRTGSNEIWMANRDGSDPIRLTHFNGYIIDSPRWSPDGTRIAFVSRRAGSADVYVVGASGGKPIRLTTATSIDKAPSWSHDGQWIYFASNRNDSWQTWKIPSRGGDAVQVTDNGGFAAQESLDGRYLFYVKRHTPGIWQRALSGGPERRVVEALEARDWGNWFVGREGLYYVHRSSEGPRLLFYNTITGQETRLAVLPDDLPGRPSFALTPDEQWIIYAQTDRRESDIFLVEDME